MTDLERTARRSASEVSRYLSERLHADVYWDSFLSWPIADPKLDALREEAAALPRVMGDNERQRLEDLVNRSVDLVNEEWSLRHYDYTITLRIGHPSIDPDEMTSALGIEPDRVNRVGEQRRSLHNEPRPLKGFYTETFWCATLREGRYPDEELVSALDKVLGTLSPHKAFFEKNRANGGRQELFIGWFFYHNSGDVFEPALFRRLAEMGLALSFYVYDHGD